jgi:hypothetical protein
MKNSKVLDCAMLNKYPFLAKRLLKAGCHPDAVAEEGFY